MNKARKTLTGIAAAVAAIGSMVLAPAPAHAAGLTAANNDPTSTTANGAIGGGQWVLTGNTISGAYGQPDTQTTVMPNGYVLRLAPTFAAPNSTYPNGLVTLSVNVSVASVTPYVFDMLFVGGRFDIANTCNDFMGSTLDIGGSVVPEGDINIDGSAATFATTVTGSTPSKVKFGVVPDTPGGTVTIMVRQRQAATLKYSTYSITSPTVKKSEGLSFYPSFNLDQDADGLAGAVEVLGHEITANGTTKTVTSDPAMKDTDSDGLGDYGEWNTYKTDPRSADTDGDGLSDSQEVALGTDPTKADTDGDGVNDKADYAPLDPNVTKAPPDTTAPTAPTVTSPASVTTGASVAVSVKAEANSTVKAVFNGLTKSGKASAAGAYATTFTAPMVAGSYTVQVTATDAAGNVSVTTSKTVTVVPEVVTLPGGDVITGSGTWVKFTEHKRPNTNRVSCSAKGKKGTYVFKFRVVEAKGSHVGRPVVGQTIRLLDSKTMKVLGWGKARTTNKNGWVTFSWNPPSNAALGTKAVRMEALPKGNAFAGRLSINNWKYTVTK